MFSLEKQVCSLELAQKLKSLNVPQESLFYWINHGEVDNPLWQLFELNEYEKRIKEEIIYSAYTVAELGELLPREYKMAVYHPKNIPSNNEYKHRFIISYTSKEHRQRKPEHGVVYEDTTDPYWYIYSFAPTNTQHVQEAGVRFEANTEANARAKMLVYLLENKLITL
jgi:hypothetical protein